MSQPTPVKPFNHADEFARIPPDFQVEDPWDRQHLHELQARPPERIGYGNILFLRALIARDGAKFDTPLPHD